jgi:hypothetical protein
VGQPVENELKEKMHPFKTLANKGFIQKAGIHY